MVVSMEKLFSEKELAKAEYFPRYHFVLVPLGDGQMNVCLREISGTEC
jgi:hypothetical protein